MGVGKVKPRHTRGINWDIVVLRSSYRSDQCRQQPVHQRKLGSYLFIQQLFPGCLPARYYAKCLEPFKEWPQLGCLFKKFLSELFYSYIAKLNMKKTGTLCTHVLSEIYIHCMLVID